jgi:hypothetical protein
MDTYKVLRGIGVLALVFAGFTTGAVSVLAAPCQGVDGTSALTGAGVSSVCALNATAFTRMTGSYLPGSAGFEVSAVAPSAFEFMTGSYLPGDTAAAARAGVSAEELAFVSMSGTYTPGHGFTFNFAQAQHR